MQLPDIAPEFTRLTVYIKDTRALTPGGVAQATGLQAEQLGPIIIGKNRISVDVHDSGIDAARPKLEAMGSLQEPAGRRARRQWFWLRLEVGRNHGLTIGQLRKLLNKVELTTLGKIEIANTHARCGIDAGDCESVIEQLASVKINGFPVKASVQESEDGRAGRYGNKPAPTSQTK